MSARERHKKSILPQQKCKKWNDKVGSRDTDGHRLAVISISQSAPYRWTYSATLTNQCNTTVCDEYMHADNFTNLSKTVISSELLMLCWCEMMLKVQKWNKKVEDWRNNEPRPSVWPMLHSSRFDRFRVDTAALYSQRNCATVSNSTVSHTATTALYSTPTQYEQRPTTENNTPLHMRL